jgi:hypothetical protein
MPRNSTLVFTMRAQERDRDRRPAGDLKCQVDARKLRGRRLRNLPQTGHAIVITLQKEPVELDEHQQCAAVIREKLTPDERVSQRPLARGGEPALRGFRVREQGLPQPEDVQHRDLVHPQHAAHVWERLQIVDNLAQRARSVRGKELVRLRMHHEHGIGV